MLPFQELTQIDKAVSAKLTAQFFHTWSKGHNLVLYHDIHSMRKVRRIFGATVADSGYAIRITFFPFHPFSFQN